MFIFRQATNGQSVLLGPFVDSTDGDTPVDDLTIANTDIRLSANGGNMAAKNSGGATHDEIGYYAATFDATDTATVGRLQIAVKVEGALAVYHDAIVLEEAVYDALYAASAPGPLPADADGSTLTEAGGTGDHLTTILGVLGTPADGDLATDIANAHADIGAVKAKTDNLPSDPADASVVAGRFDTLDGAVGDLPTNTELAAALAAYAATQVTESYAANGVAPTRDELMLAIHQHLTMFGIDGTSRTVYKLDGTTPAFVETLDDGTTPTALTRAA
jgi:hypothetical protein